MPDLKSRQLIAQLSATARTTMTAQGPAPARSKRGRPRGRGTYASPESRWLEQNCQVVTVLLTCLNTPPYPEIDHLAQFLSMSSEDAMRIVTIASGILGLPVPTTEMQTIRRTQGTGRLTLICEVCNRTMGGQARPHLDGKFYCASHRYRHAPGYREFLNIYQRNYVMNRRQLDPDYDRQMRDYQRAYQQAKRQSNVAVSEQAE